MAKFKVPSIKSKLIHQFEFWKIYSTSMENDAGEQSLALPQLFPYKSSWLF